jgi:hypothetical protein
LFKFTPGSSCRNNYSSVYWKPRRAFTLSSFIVAGKNIEVFM